MLAVASVASYLLFAAGSVGQGYPLDDAWIHQTYARNLAELGEWSFVPGQASAGSTSPLWTILLAIGYVLGVQPAIWTGLLGAGVHALTAWLSYRLVGRLWPELNLLALSAGIVIALEWHLVWAAASGMETLLFIALVLATFTATRPQQSPIWSGVFAGLALWTRPDGLTLLPFLVLALWLIDGEIGTRFTRIALALLGFLFLALPYLAFNVQLSGSIWPNTLMAKQTEYAFLQTAPLAQRLMNLAMPPLMGALALIAPGAILLGKRAGFKDLIPMLWAVSFIFVYALRLPAVYQYGRYVMPTIPVLVIFGMAGVGTHLQLQGEMLPRIVSRTWLLATVIILAGFWVIGARRFRTDVQIINTEMVATAHWIAKNTPTDATIAAHDIGALGYYSEREIIDLAGLISPEVIPFIRDETRLAAFLQSEGAAYLMTFPGWYPQIVNSGEWEIAFATNAPFAPVEGGENMAVYSLTSPE